MSLVVPFEEIFAQETGLLARAPHWERVELSEVTSILNGYAFKSKLFSKDQGFPLIRIRDIANSKAETYYTGEYSSEYIVNSGDLIIGMDGNFACYEWKGKPGLLNQRVCKISPNRNYLLRKFLLFALNGYLQAIQNATSSVTVTHLSSRDIGKIPFPLPPLNEQSRIIETLEAILTKCETSKQRLDRIPHILKRFRQSILAAACSGRLTADWREQNPDVEPASALVDKTKKNHELAGGHKKGNAAAPTEGVHILNEQEFPESWSLSEMRDLCEPGRPITYGILKPGPDVSDGVPYIRVADFPNDKITPSGIRKTSQDIDSKYTRSKLLEGDILLSIRGTVGRVCRISKDLEGANITQDSARLSIQTCIDPEYICWFLRAEPTQKRMQLAVKGVAVRGINIGDVRALQVPVPPIQEQREIVQRVERLFKVADQIEKRYEKAKAFVDKLPQAILAKAFRGELVPQDPADEPASVLLERIQAERAQREAEAKAAKKAKGKTTTGKKRGRKPKAQNGSKQLSLSDLENDSN
jgi:type I restriction enzyme S subunit